jgi:uncharacterized protein
MGGRPLVVAVADLRRQPGTRRRVERDAVLPGLAVTSAHVPDGEAVGVDLELEALSNGLVATGTVHVPWEGECRRCLRHVRGETEAEVREIFEPRPVEGETYPLADDTVDLEPLVRDAVLLALPLAPLCGPDCKGPAPDDFPTGVAEEEPAEAGDEVPSDPRWAALDALRFDSGEDDG